LWKVTYLLFKVQIYKEVVSLKGQNIRVRRERVLIDMSFIAWEGLMAA
jgi:hypothetical protein